MMKNAFYFTFEALFVLKIFNFFFLRFFGHVRKQVDKKPKVISKFMTSSTGKLINAIHIIV